MQKRRDTRRGRTVVSKLFCHLVFFTRDRAIRFETTDIHRFADWADAVLKKLGAELLAVNGRGDRLHLLVAFPPKLTVSLMVNTLKGVLGRRYNKQHKTRGRALWSPSYHAITVGPTTRNTIHRYLAGPTWPELTESGSEE